MTQNNLAAPKLTIIIVSYNRKNDLIKCLKSIFQSTYSNLSVIIIDNNSIDKAGEVAKKEFPQIQLIPQKKNFGFAKANNIGIKIALQQKAKFVLLCNNDVVFQKNALSKLIQARSKADIVLPLIYHWPSRKVWFSGGKIYPGGIIKHFKNDLKKEKYTQFINLCCALISRKVFETIGLLDERFFLYYEDADFTRRAQKVGFRAVVWPKAKIFHLFKSDFNCQTIFYQTQSLLKFSQKHYSKLNQVLFYGLFPFLYLYWNFKAIKRKHFCLIEYLTNNVGQSKQEGITNKNILENNRPNND